MGDSKHSGVVALVLLSALALCPSAMADSGLGDQVRAVHRAHPTLAGRHEAVSRLLLGRPFRLSPLGEGPGRAPDPDPLMDLSRFDCVTFVEQVMALSWHEDLKRAETALQRLRYLKGEVRYGARNHIMMAQWIPHNVAAGFVRDITAQVAGPATRFAHLTIKAGDFERGPGSRLGLAVADRPVGRHAVAVVPIGQMHRWVDQVPAPTLLTTIRSARSGVPYRASHVGLVVVVGGQRRLRHADSRAGAVVDEPLAEYVARCRRFRSRPVVGFNLLAVNDGPATVRAR